MLRLFLQSIFKTLLSKNTSFLKVGDFFFPNKWYHVKELIEKKMYFLLCLEFLKMRFCVREPNQTVIIACLILVSHVCFNRNMVYVLINRSE